jgi:hypothetical protein
MATNITFHEGAVGQDERASMLGQKGATVWLTGLSASGKVSRGAEAQAGGRTKWPLVEAYPSPPSPLPSSSTSCTSVSTLTVSTVTTSDSA